MEQFVKFSYGSQEIKELLLAIVNSSAADVVKVAALEVLKHKTEQPQYTTITNCNFTNNEVADEEDDAS